MNRRQERRKPTDGARNDSPAEAAGAAPSATLLDLLLDARDSGPVGAATAAAPGAASVPSKLSDPELLDNAVTFLLAGAVGRNMLQAQSSTDAQFSCYTLLCRARDDSAGCDVGAVPSRKAHRVAGAGSRRGGWGGLPLRLHEMRLWRSVPWSGTHTGLASVRPAWWRLASAAANSR